MSEERLTINDPVSVEEMARIDQLDMARQGIANENLLLDQKKIQLLGAAKRVDAEYQRVFDQILVDRGLEPGTPVSIGKDNRLKILRPKEPPVPTEAPSEAPRAETTPESLVQEAPETPLPDEV